MAKEVVFEQASLFKRFVAYFLDISLWLITSLIFFTVCNTLINQTPWYKDINGQVTEIKNSSGLYEDGVVISSYVDEDNSFLTAIEKKDFMSSRIDTFYANSTFFSNQDHLNQYNARKNNAIVDGAKLFTKSGENYVENPVNPQYLLNFYKTEVNDYSLGYLFNISKYGDLTRTIFIKSMVEFISSATIFFGVYFLLLPLTCFKRGRQTIGMKVQNIALINSKGVNIKTKTYLLRFAFMLLIMVYVNFIALLLPTFISVGMTLLSKNKQSLVNYIFIDYAVDVSNKTIYLSEAERFLALAKLQEATIENTDFIVK